MINKRKTHMDYKEIQDPIVRSVMRSLQNEIEDRKQMIATVVLEDYASYRAELGRIRGLADAVILIKDLLKDSATSDEENE